MIIIWEITNRCNLACRFCHVRKNTGPTAIEGNIDLVGQEDFIGKIKRTLERQKESLMINWTGGEPLLAQELFPITRRWKELFGCRFGVTTNGTLISADNNARLLSEDFDEITVSMDGYQDSHDYFRRSKGLYHRVKENLKLLMKQVAESASSTKVRVNSIIHARALGTIEAFIQDIASCGIHEIAFTPLLANKAGTESDLLLHTKQIDQLSEFIELRREFEAIYKIRILGHERYYERMLAWMCGRTHWARDCRPGRNAMYITYSGRILPCCSFYPRDIPEIPTTMEYCNRRSIDGLYRRLEILLGNRDVVSCRNCFGSNYFGKFEHA